MADKIVYVVTVMQVRRSDSDHWNTQVIGVYSSKKIATAKMAAEAKANKAHIDSLLLGTGLEGQVEMEMRNHDEICVRETYGGDADSFTYNVSESSVEE